MRTNIRSLILTVAMLIASIATFAQNKAEWKELSAFHTVMSQTFHPAEEGDLHPIRERSVEMVAKAKSWQASAIPADYKDVKGIQENLAALLKGSTKLDAKIKAGATDAEITTDLSALHDVFHKIVGLCRPAGGGHHH